MKPTKKCTFSQILITIQYRTWGKSTGGRISRVSSWGRPTVQMAGARVQELRRVTGLRSFVRFFCRRALTLTK